MTVPATVNGKKSAPVDVVREWIREYVNDNGSTVSIKVLRSKARDEFLGDEEFLAAAAGAWLDELVPVFLGSVIRNSRQQGHLPIRNTNKMDAQDFQARVLTKLEAWFESPRPGVHKLLLDHVKPELRSVLDQRREQVAGELRVIAFEEDLFKHLKDDRTKLRDALDRRELALIWRTHFGEEEE